MSWHCKTRCYSDLSELCVGFGKLLSGNHLSTRSCSLMCCPSQEALPLVDSVWLALSECMIRFIVVWRLVEYLAVTTQFFFFQIKMYHPVLVSRNHNSRVNPLTRTVTCEDAFRSSERTPMLSVYVNVSTFRGHVSDLSIVSDRGLFRGQRSVIDAVCTQPCWRIRLLSYPTNYDWNSTRVGYGDANLQQHLAQVF